MATDRAGSDAPTQATPPGRRLWELSDLTTPYALRAAVAWDLVVHLEAGATTVVALAQAAEVPVAAVRAVTGVLVDQGVLEITNGQLQPTELGELLHPDHPASHHDVLRSDGVRAYQESALPGLAGAPEGTTAFARVHGRSFWDDLRTHPDLHAAFDDHLAAFAATWTGAAADLPLWRRCERVADLGGGLGLLASALVDRWDHLLVTVVEQGATVPRAQRSVAGRPRIEVVDGDLFAPGVEADTCVLAQVLHDWHDPQASDVLRAAAACCTPGGRVVVIERVAEELDPAGHRLQLLVWALFGAAERTLDELLAVFDRAGLTLLAREPLGGALYLHELEVQQP